VLKAKGERQKLKEQRRLLLIIPAACLVPAVLDVFQSYLQAKLFGGPLRWQDLLFQGAEWIFLGALTPITFYLAKRYPLRGGSWKRSLAAHFLGAIGLCIGWASLGLLLGMMLKRHPAFGHIPTAYLSWLLRSVPWSVFMYFTVLGCVYAFSYFMEAREREAQLAEARLSALRAQLHPHFLFNSLNALAVLVREQDTPGASRMLELLSDLLRRVLRSDPRQKVPLPEELQFLEQYLAIEQIRFSDRLRVEWSIDERARTASVPGFVMQPLVENAIKHGVAKRAEAGRIEISARVEGERLELAVRDDGVGMAPGTAEGVGLSNTRERLHTMYGNEGSLTLRALPGGGTEVSIRIPFR
jgi:glucose-6-phosphate-specific signal transduction histidine kinase